MGLSNAFNEPSTTTADRRALYTLLIFLFYYDIVHKVQHKKTETKFLIIKIKIKYTKAEYKYTKLQLDNRQ